MAECSRNSKFGDDSWRADSKVRIIFSRKGFDSATGRVPSPIFRDNEMRSLPIPDETSEFKYRCITGNSPASIAALVRDLTNGRIKPSHGVHLDPDLDWGRCPRDPGWRPLFGQADAAQSHLENHGIGRGDIFLFFGLFRRVERVGGSWRSRRDERAKHVIWGWLQIDEMIDIDLSRPRSCPAWALYHPHFSLKKRRKNMLYVAGRALDLPGLGKRRFRGAGIFPRFAAGLQLTAPDCDGASSWLLPMWIHPKGRESILTYHGNPNRWQVKPQGVVLSTVGRGQEFVLDCEHYPEAVDWLANLVKRYSS
jgi:hypothetical protein